MLIIRIYQNLSESIKLIENDRNLLKNRVKKKKTLFLPLIIQTFIKQIF